MNEPKVMEITYTNGTDRWESGKVVGLEEIAKYIERDSQIFLPIVVGETKNAYGQRTRRSWRRRYGGSTPTRRTRPYDPTGTQAPVSVPRAG